MSLLLEQLFTFTVLLGAGVIIGLVFDMYRVARGITKPPKIISHILDLIIWFILALLVFVLLLFSNWGEVRFYVFLSLVIGLVFYFKFCSSTVIKILLKIVALVKKIAATIIKLLLYPLKIVLLPFKKVGGFFYSKINKRWQSLKATIKKIRKIK